jgi:TonB family protein
LLEYPLKQSNRKSAAAWLGSVLVHAALLLALLLVSVPEARRAVRQRWTPLLAPELPTKTVRRVPRAVLRMPPRAILQNAILLPAAPELAVSRRSVANPMPAVTPSLPKLPAQTARIDLPPANAPTPAVRTGVFDLSTPETAKKPPRAAEMGAFGEPARATTNAAALHLQIGAFDGQPSAGGAPAAKEKAVGASGFGDSARAGAATPRGTAAPASAGFDTLSADSSRPTGRPQVSATQFEQAAVKPPSDHIGRVSAAPVETTNLEILDKPRPMYTDEARRLHIEGEVLIQALFEASGRIRVLKVIRALGHGLDENAETAASAIHFRPATKNGQATDIVAVVRIQFQLVY